MRSRVSGRIGTGEGERGGPRKGAWTGKGRKRVNTGTPELGGNGPAGRSARVALRGAALKRARGLLLMSIGFYACRFSAVGPSYTLDFRYIVLNGN